MPTSIIYSLVNYFLNVGLPVALELAIMDMTLISHNNCV